MNLVEWGRLLKDLIVQGANLHHISSEYSTPFVNLLQGLRESKDYAEPNELAESDFDDPESMEPSWIDLKTEQSWKLPLLLNFWLEFLQESGVDLEDYGQKEVDLRLRGLVSWTWEWPSDPEKPALFLKNIRYGPSPNDWKVDIEYRHRRRRAAESPVKMPGG